MAGEVILLRHGQTEWSRDGRHTGLSDIELTDIGVAQSRDAGLLVKELLGGQPPARVLTSPLSRARRTAELAGLDAETDDRLVEWDYGGYEGLTTPQIREIAQPHWTVFKDGVVPGQTPGETISQVATRLQAVVDDIRPSLADGDVVLIAHGHALRVLAACWLDADPCMGSQLLLDTAGVCVLGAHHGVPGLQHWNLTATLTHTRA